MAHWVLDMVLEQPLGEGYNSGALLPCCAPTPGKCSGSREEYKGAEFKGRGCSSISQHSAQEHGSALGHRCCGLHLPWLEPSWKTRVLEHPGAARLAGTGTLATGGVKVWGN